MPGHSTSLCALRIRATSLLVDWLRSYATSPLPVDHLGLFQQDQAARGRPTSGPPPCLANVANLHALHMFGCSQGYGGDHIQPSSYQLAQLRQAEHGTPAHPCHLAVDSSHHPGLMNVCVPLLVILRAPFPPSYCINHVQHRWAPLKQRCSAVSLPPIHYAPSPSWQWRHSHHQLAAASVLTADFYFCSSCHPKMQGLP